jgi:hypothetical protein
VLPAVPPPAGVLAGYQERLVTTAQRDIADSSLVAYRSGWHKYVGFCKVLGVDPVTHGIAWHDIFEAFILYAVEDANRRLHPKTADKYVTAVLKRLDHMGAYDIRKDARSPRYQAVYDALLRAHKAQHPLRLEARIPFTVPFILWSFGYIDRTFSDPAYQRALKAALVTGHCFSLRTGEYLHTSKEYTPERYLCAATTLAWFGDTAFRASEAASWPSGTPTHISSALDVRKNSQDCGGPVAVAANPHVGEFCCVRILAEYIRQANLSDEDPLLIFKGAHITDAEVSSVLKACAVHHDIDPKRVVPTSLRKNVISQMELNSSQLCRQLQGGWRSDAGEKHYWTQLLQVADANESAVHNAGCATIAVIKAIFENKV